MGKMSFFRISAILVIFAATTSGSSAMAEKEKPAALPKPGIYLELTEDFYKALREDAGNTRRYSTQMSEAYLRQIAVSTRFMVETNLQILRQQEKMIQLLEEMRSTAKRP